MWIELSVEGMNIISCGGRFDMLCVIYVYLQLSMDQGMHLEELNNIVANIVGWIECMVTMWLYNQSMAIVMLLY